jgi:GNAT superfamily N-acetyltransferase
MKTDTANIEVILRPYQITMRPISAADLPLLQQIYGSTREAELAMVDWSDQQKSDFIAMQFQAQHTYYQEHYQQAAFRVILYQNTPVGRLYLDYWPEEIRIVDIALLSHARGQGIGTRILEAIFAESARIGLPIRIHVEMFNPALQLYQRLGFVPVDQHGVYYLMEYPVKERHIHA